MILAYLLLSVLVSCSDVKDYDNKVIDTSVWESTDESNAEAQTGEAVEIITETDAKAVSDAALAQIPEFDFNAENVIIVSTYDHTFLPEDTENLVNVKQYERMNMLEEKYNFKFVKRVVNENTAFIEARNAHLADLYYADLMYVSPDSLWRYDEADIIANIETLPFVNTDADYYDRKSMDAANVNGNIYALIGDSNTDFDNLPCVFFNRELLGDFDIYAEVYSGNWTLDAMTGLSNNAHTNLDGTFTDINGLVTDFTQARFVDNLYYSANLINVEKNGGSLPVYSAFDENAQACVDSIAELMYGANGYRRTNDARQIFESGNSLFLVSTLSEKNNLVNSEFDWGIVPLPMFNAQGSYNILKNEDFPITLVLSSTPDKTRCGVLLESINAAMHGYISEAYYDNCMYEIVRDNDTLNMISIIQNSAKCDFAHMYGDGIYRLGECTYNAVYSAVTGTRNLEYYNNRGGDVNFAIEEYFPPEDI